MSSPEGDPPIYDTGIDTPDVRGNYQPDNQPAYTPTYLESSDDSDQADDNRAALARAEWADYKKRFVPIENELIGQIGDPGTYRENVQRSVDSVNTAYQTGAGEFQRGLSRYGVQPSAIESQQYDRQRGLSKARATAEAANRTRSAVKNRDMQILGGGLAPQDLRKQQQG